MTPAQHPSEAVLTDYAAGALRPAFAAVVAAHLEVCDGCGRAVRTLEDVAGALIADMEPAALSDEALDRVMAGIERPLQAATPPRATVDRIPFGREQWLAPGMSIRKARISGERDLLYLLRLPAGLRTIPHGHRGTEFTTVLKGAFDDGHGVFAAGDFAETGEAVDHQPSVTPGSECICLIASETPMRVRTPVGHLVHWLTGV